MVSAFADVEFFRTSSMTKKLISMFPVFVVEKLDEGDNHFRDRDICDLIS